jgi:hypothetical protein
MKTTKARKGWVTKAIKEKLKNESKEVRKCMHSVTIQPRSSGFDFCHIKYWKNTTRILVTLEKHNPEDGDSMSLRNVGIYLQVHTASQPRRPVSTIVI